MVAVEQLNRERRVLMDRRRASEMAGFINRSLDADVH